MFLPKFHQLRIFSKIEKFQNALKSILILRFCSNEHVIEMRWFCAQFWQKKILENFLKNFRISENPIKFVIFLPAFAYVPGVLHWHRFVRFSNFFQKQKVEPHSFSTSPISFCNSSWLLLKVFFSSGSHFAKVWTNIGNLL